MQAGREFDFTDQDFKHVCNMIYQRAGIALGESKRHMVYSRLARRLRALNLTTFDAYLEALQRQPESEEWQEFINALTTNLTSFFREAHHFDVLAEALPKWKTPINIWCSAASTGEEPYSIAMTVLETMGSSKPPVHILASDLDTQVLARAEQGIYPIERLDKMDVQRRNNFFLRGKGAQEGYVRVRQELRDLIVFRQINLLHDNWPVRAPLNAIFCRNVMIYFDKPTQRSILEKFAPLLAPDALVFVGHSESLHHVSDLFSPVGRTVYQLKSSRRGK